MTFERFSFDSVESINTALADLGLELPCSSSLASLHKPVPLGSYTVPNAWACHPMEACDGTADGAPGPLTFRRYERFAAGGAGLIWFEASAVRPDGRAVPRQLFITRDNIQAFADIRNGADAKTALEKASGQLKTAWAKYQR